ncbi:MAG: beta-fructofuranosidase [Flavobacteriales bacterium]|jgi:beta-fructofuranosidase|tara:strand:+ start:9631 stop:11103 length:1473 start_codon:yes stop_codon:yes gene_type:complete
MYTGSGFTDWEIGDVEVHVHNGIYHLFHLIIPNHDYIAHAVSKDGIAWSRVKNAMFVGDPGEWDDDMLWTMDVADCEDGTFEMFYTGLQLEDRGINQRVGRAVSKDLIHWEKTFPQDLPIESSGPHYEDLENNPRTWLSFRDPFLYKHKGEDYLLICGRASHGPVYRRGAVTTYKRNGSTFEPIKPLLYPMAYDDIECPSLIELKGKFYLIGSIREDIKVRYWHSDSFDGEYQSFHHDVLMPQGNYAARIVKDGEHNLVYSFYFLDRQVNSKRVLPPPKELAVDEKGKLFLKSFYKWNEKVTKTYIQKDFPKVERMYKNSTAKFEDIAGKWWMASRSGYELFTFKKLSEAYIWEGTITMEGMGKCGLLLSDGEDGSGYYISLDFKSGYVQIRAWGFNPDDPQNNFLFKNLQTNQFIANNNFSIDFKLIRYGNYFELSIDDVVKLTLIDYKYSESRIGFYSASSILTLSNSKFSVLENPSEEYATQQNDVD